MIEVDALRSRIGRALGLRAPGGDSQPVRAVQAVHLVWRYGVYWEATLPLMLFFSALCLVCGAIDLTQGETGLGLAVMGTMVLLVLLAVASARYHQRVLVGRRGVAIKNPFKQRFYRWRHIRGIEETGSLLWIFDHVYELTFTDGSNPVIFLGTESTAAIFLAAKDRAESARKKSARPA